VHIVYFALFKVVLFLKPGPVCTVDWPSLIGSEPPGRDLKVWGIIQSQYVYDFEDDIESRAFIKAGVGPLVRSQAGSALERAKAWGSVPIFAICQKYSAPHVSLSCMIKAGANLMHGFLGEGSRSFGIFDSSLHRLVRNKDQ